MFNLSLLVELLNMSLLRNVNRNFSVSGERKGQPAMPPTPDQSVALAFPPHSSLGFSCVVITHGTLLHVLNVVYRSLVRVACGVQ